MLDRLPEFIDPILLAERRRILTVKIKLSEFNRLSGVLANDNSDDVAINLSFEKVGRLTTVRGSIKATIALQCQTCLKEVLYPIDTQVNLGLVSTPEQTDRLAEEFEPLWLETDNTLSLNQLVEDELLLVIPDFPGHDYDCMEIKQAFSDHDNQQQKSNNPFAVLAKLKNTGE